MIRSATAGFGEECPSELRLWSPDSYPEFEGEPPLNEQAFRTTSHDAEAGKSAISETLSNAMATFARSISSVREILPQDGVELGRDIGLRAVRLIEAIRTNTPVALNFREVLLLVTTLHLMKVPSISPLSIYEAMSGDHHGAFELLVEEIRSI